MGLESHRATSTGSVFRALRRGSIAGSASPSISDCWGDGSAPFRSAARARLRRSAAPRGRGRADAIHLFDCVMPCAGAEAFLVMGEETAASLKLPAAKILSTIERHNAFGDDPVQVRGGWAMDVDELYAMAGAKPDDLDFV